MFFDFFSFFFLHQPVSSVNTHLKQLPSSRSSMSILRRLLLSLNPSEILLLDTNYTRRPSCSGSGLTLISLSPRDAFSSFASSLFPLLSLAFHKAQSHSDKCHRHQFNQSYQWLGHTAGGWQLALGKVCFYLLKRCFKQV